MLTANYRFELKQIRSIIEKEQKFNFCPSLSLVKFFENIIP